ncbi:uncharacterized protein LOC112341580 [Selaginella moellendorffii]|uniref:uncharacterized protein LOC112341580 n=1 Tax=Selaginella moellendorffii TaxID=88036 RepID=UPI000D1C7F35|nr:uncharacterized protein LOC112341580 [Selaginella moellendorffii]|eukprot:XP_024517698.1 uncharacterized protein LOC112341580 [Selaginella moellendorffii]
MANASFLWQIKRSATTRFYRPASADENHRHKDGFHLKIVSNEEEKTYRIQCSHRKAQVHHRIEDTTFSRWKIAEHLQRPGTILVLHLEEQVYIYRVPDSKTPAEQNPFGNVQWLRLGLVPDPVDESRLHRLIHEIKVGNLPLLSKRREDPAIHEQEVLLAEILVVADNRVIFHGERIGEIDNVGYDDRIHSRPLHVQKVHSLRGGDETKIKKCGDTSRHGVDVRRIARDVGTEVTEGMAALDQYLEIFHPAERNDLRKAPGRHAGKEDLGDELVPAIVKQLHSSRQQEPTLQEVLASFLVGRGIRESEQALEGM